MIREGKEVDFKVTVAEMEEEKAAVSETEIPEQDLG